MTSQLLNCVTVRGEKYSENVASFSDKSIPLLIDGPRLLFRRQFQRRSARQDHLDPRAAARLGVEVEPTAEAVGHDAVDDVQAKPVPPWSRRVVKNGSNARRRTSRLCRTHCRKT